MVGRMLSQTRAQLDAALAEYRSLTGRVKRMRDELASLTATARSDDGSARVTVNAWGELVDLTFDPGAARLERPVLAARVVAAAASAAAEARRRKQALISDLLPPGLRRLVAEEGVAGLRLLADDTADAADAPASPGGSR
jgi:DNA-binding protein YbaB